MENPLTRTAAYGEADLRAAVMLIDAGGGTGPAATGEAD